MDILSVAIERGVNYLKGRRYEDGSFPAVKPHDHGGAWTTAENLLSLYESGIRMDEDWVEESIKFLVDNQRPDGSWYLISEPPSATLSTADATLALCRAKSAGWVSDSLNQKVARAIAMGFRWLKVGQNEDGGWGIEYRPYTEEGNSRVTSTFHAMRVLSMCGTDWLPEEEIRDMIARCVQFHLDTQDRESGGWGFHEGSPPNVYSTARAIRSVLFSKQIRSDSASVKRGLDYIRHNQDDPVLSSIQEELVTRAVALLRIDCHTPYDLLCALIESKEPDLKLLQLAKWFIDVQNKDGSWNLRCPVTGKTWEATMWVTCDIVWAMTEFKQLVDSEPHFLLRCLVSRFPSLVIQDALVDGLFRNGFDTFDRLLMITPRDIVNTLPADQELDKATADAISHIFEYASLCMSDQRREAVGKSWLEIGDESADIECKAKAYALATDLLSDPDVRHRALALSVTYEAIVSLTRGDVEEKLRDRLVQATKLLAHSEEFPYLEALHELVHEYVGFENETDAFMVALRGTRAALAIERLENAIAANDTLVRLIGGTSFVTLRQGIEAKLATLSSELESAVITEIRGDLEQGQPSSVRCLVRTVGLPVYNLTVNLSNTSELKVSAPERKLPVVNINWSELLFTVTPVGCGRVRMPLTITYTDVNQVTHEMMREHEVKVHRAPLVYSDKDFSEIPNPFVAGPSIMTQSMFFGRKDELSAVLNSVRNTNQPYAVVGPRRIGKTSLLHALERQLQDDPLLVSVFLDMEAVPTALEFLRRITESVLIAVAGSALQDYMDRSSILKEVADSVAVIDQLGFLNIEGREEPETLEAQLAYRKTEAVFAKLASLLAKHNMKCVILLDEIGVLGSIVGSTMLLGFLRSLIQRFIEFIFIVAGPDILFELTSLDHPFFNLFEKLSLKGLSKAESITLMTEPVPQVEYEDEAMELIYSLTGSNPYYLQAVCKALVSLLNDERRYRVTLADAESAIEQIAVQLDDQSRFQWKDTTPVEHLVLSSVATLGGHCDTDQIVQAIQESTQDQKAVIISETDFATALQRLFEKGYLVKAGTHYRFSDGIFNKWVSLRHKLTDVIKEEFVGRNSSVSRGNR